MSDIDTLLVECSRLAAQSFRDAAHNARSLRGRSTGLKQLDSRALFDRLGTHQMTGGAKFIGSLKYDEVFASVSAERFCGELDDRRDSPIRFMLILHVTAEKKLAPNVMRNLFELNTAMFLSNLCIDAMARRDKSQDWKTICATAGDEVMYQASILEQSFVHAANLNQHPHSRAYLLSLIGMSNGDALQSKDHASADRHFMECLEAFNASTPAVGANLMKNAFNPSALRERIGKSPAAFTTIPILFFVGFIKERDKFINDVWLPTPWAEPIMAAIVKGQAEALMAEHGAR